MFIALAILFATALIRAFSTIFNNFGAIIIAILGICFILSAVGLIRFRIKGVLLGAMIGTIVGLILRVLKWISRKFKNIFTWLRKKLSTVVENPLATILAVLIMILII